MVQPIEFIFVIFYLKNIKKLNNLWQRIFKILHSIYPNDQTKNENKSSEFLELFPFYWSI